MRRRAISPNVRWRSLRTQPPSRESEPDDRGCFPEGPPRLPGADQGDDRGCFPENPARGRGCFPEKPPRHRHRPFDRLIQPR